MPAIQLLGHLGTGRAGVLTKGLIQARWLLKKSRAGSTQDPDYTQNPPDRFRYVEPASPIRKVEFEPELVS